VRSEKHGERAGQAPEMRGQFLIVLEGMARGKDQRIERSNAQEAQGGERTRSQSI